MEINSPIIKARATQLHPVVSQGDEEEGICVGFLNETKNEVKNQKLDVSTDRLT